MFSLYLWVQMTNGQLGLYITNTKFTRLNSHWTLTYTVIIPVSLRNVRVHFIQKYVFLSFYDAL